MAMDPATLAARIAELRTQYPAMFSQAELKPNELCFDQWNAEVMNINLARFRKVLPSMRLSQAFEVHPVTAISYKAGGRDPKKIQIPCHFHFVFCDQREYVELEEAEKK